MSQETQELPQILSHTVPADREKRFLMITDIVILRLVIERHSPQCGQLQVSVHGEP